MSSSADLTNYQQYYLNCYLPYQVVFERGKGSYLYDEQNRAYLDFSGGVAVNALGHCHPAIVDTICKHAANLLHTSNWYITKPKIALVKRLCELTAMSRGFIANSGAEANEAALKVARKYGRAVSSQKTRVLSFEGCFHGRVGFSMSATNTNQNMQDYGPLADNFLQLPFNDEAALINAFDHQVCAVIVELIQGEGGVNLIERDFLRKIRMLCDQHDALLIVDEVQTGMLRTGEMFAVQKYDIAADIITLGKALASGLPIGVCLCADKCAQVIVPGGHGSTFGGNPLICEVALEVIKQLQCEQLQENVRQSSAYLREQLEKIATEYSFLHEVRGEGLLFALQLNETHKVSDLLKEMFAEKLLALPTANNALRIAPSLLVSVVEIDEAMIKLRKSLKTLSQQDI